MPLELKDFRREFEQLFEDTKDVGSLNLSFKRIVYPYQKKGPPPPANEPPKPAPGPQNIRCIVRAKTHNEQIHDHDAMRAFSDISELEINSIIKLENETILNCLHGLYYLEGLFEIRCRNVRTFLCVFIGEMILCLIVSSLRLLGNWG